MRRYNISFSCVSHIGNCRRMNQDNFFCNESYMELENSSLHTPISGSICSTEKKFFGVFDGMGGEECGEVAAYIAAKSAKDIKLKKDISKDVMDFCKMANNRICNYASKNSISCMGTTGAMAVFGKKEIVFCNIGDSKIFALADQRLEQISQDHVALSVFGRKPPLLQYLGIPEQEMLIEPYIFRKNYHDGDTFLICSDGLTDMVTEEDIYNILKETSFDVATNVLLQKALQNGGKDNVTIILLKIGKKSGVFRRKGR